MACLVCDHTMQSVVRGVWWCPRCGSLKIDDQHSVPTLVSTVRYLLPTINNSYTKKILDEKVNLPENRKKDWEEGK